MAQENSLKIILTAEKFTPDDELEKYAYKKVAALERYLPRHSRGSAQAEVRLKRAAKGEKSQNTCDITLHLPQSSLHAKETMEHMFAAIDVVSASIRHQIAEYKTKHEPAKLRHRITRKFGSSANPEA